MSIPRFKTELPRDFRVELNSHTMVTLKHLVKAEGLLAFVLRAFS
jgi:hypothetical protein